MTDYSIPGDGYRWTCPYCGESRLNKSEDDAGERNAIAALRSHVLASDSLEHGPVNAYPDAFDPDELGEHVVRVEERGGVVGSE